MVKQKCILNLIGLLKYTQFRKANCKSTIIKAGFTLIELSIVLVIIGLIVGGVLFGVDLKKSAEIRAQIKQVELYKTAVNSFKIKYKFLPGDLPSFDAAQLGFTSRLGTTWHGDGDGVIANCAGTGSGTDNVGCERTLFFSDLSSANMIDGTFNSAVDDVPTGGLLTATLSQLYKYFPVGKIGNSYFTASYYPTNYKNRFTITRYITDFVAGTATNDVSLTPMQAFNIDLKIDDGNPRTGTVWGSSNVPAAQASGVCVTTETNNPYNVSNPAYQDVLSCNIWFFW